MSDKTDGPVTLGDKLKLQRSEQLALQKSRQLKKQRSRHSIEFLDRKSLAVRDRKSFRFPRILFIPPIIGLLSWWASASPIIGIGAMSLAILYFTLVYFDKVKQNVPTTKKRKRVKQSWDNNTLLSGDESFLISYDKQGFMTSLKLSDKTVIFDGNNIYLFGVKNGVGTKVLETLVRELRAEGFRIVCFFDANIFYKMRDNNAFQNIDIKFSISIIKTAFGLRTSEIYIVPGRQQADKFIIESLSLLPISFVVTNDRFRDFEDKYNFLAKDKQWRKGVTIKGGKLLLYQHKFKQPLVM